MVPFSIHRYNPGEEKEIFNLVKAGFDKFVSSDCTKEGTFFFYNFIDPGEFIKRNQSDTFTLTAKTEEGRIVGMIEVKNDGHICLLFVSKDFHHSGISKKLFKHARDICKKNNHGEVIMSVNSSIYAIEIYKKLGFHTEGKTKTINGISFIEMKF
jgi:ribosomal protein S18 acetylase RimI-like enzyme